MAQSARIGLVAALVVLAADIVVLATGAVSDDAALSTTPSTTTTTALATVPTLPGETTLATDTTAVGVGETTTAPAVTEAETTTTAPPVAPPAPVQRTMPAPGSYTMNVSGSENGQFPLTVEQLNATDQRLTTYSETGATVQENRYTPTGVQLLLLDLGQLGRFAPNPPVLFAPVPLELGAHWTWTMSSDRGTRIDHESTVAAFERVTVGGRQVGTFVIETTLNVSGNIRASITVTSWASPDYAMAVRTHQVVSVSFPLIFNSDTTSELASLDPA